LHWAPLGLCCGGLAVAKAGRLGKMRPFMSTSRRPADIARRSAKAVRARPRDVFRRETFALSREKAREKAREMFRRFPKAAYMIEIESWRESPRPHRVHHAAASERGLTTWGLLRRAPAAGHEDYDTW
jgi:hypothetical protein